MSLPRVVAVMLALLGSATPLDAHLRLVAASPSAGAELSRSPDEIRLHFSQPVEVAFSAISLVGPSGTIETGSVGRPPGADSVLVAAIPTPLEAGRYTIAWRTSGADGHPIRGELSFDVRAAADPSGTAAETAPPTGPGATEPDPVPPPSSGAAANAFDAESPIYAAIRWLTFAGLLAAIGAAAFRILVLGRAIGSHPADVADLGPLVARGAATLGLIASVALVLALALRLGAQSVALHGATDAAQADRLTRMVGGTVWGWGWVAQAAGTALALAGFVLARGARRGGWPLAGAGVLLLAFTPALSGHAAGIEELGVAPVVADGLHVLGAGGWLGSLLALLAVGIPVALHAAPDRRGPAIAALVEAFSPTALLFAALVVGTGVISAWIHLGGPAELWTTPYGRTLLVKLAVLLGVFGTGAYNWLRARPALGTELAARRIRRSAAAELAIGAIVLAVTAVLVATPPG